MAQEKVSFNGKVTKQPDAGLGFDFETTYTEDSGRIQTGVANITPMFTVESFSYTATDLTLEEMSEILHIVAKGEFYTMHYLSPYYGRWRDDTFYTGRGTLVIGSWKENEERYESLSFNIIGRNPI